MALLCAQARPLSRRPLSSSFVLCSRRSGVVTSESALFSQRVGEGEGAGDRWPQPRSSSKTRRRDIVFICVGDCGYAQNQYRNDKSTNLNG